MRVGIARLRDGLDAYRPLRYLEVQCVIAPDLLAVRLATDRIRKEYVVVRQAQPKLTPWEAFAVAKQRRAGDIVAANTAIDLAEIERRYRPASPARPVDAR
jgi:hypothetical protein